jgi:uncharacterized membrane protein YraQ (UPF0718 family)
MEELFWGAVVRIAQAAMQASPTVVIGLLVAAIFQRMTGRDGTRKVFGGDTWRQLPQAWAMGMLLPICSLGAIPVMSEMRRAGIAGGVILAFGLTAPLFNPVSVLYGLTLSDPIAILVFSLCSLAIVTVMGSLWDRLFPSSATNVEHLQEMPYGWRRLVAVIVAMSRMAYSRDMIYILAGIFGVGLLSLFLRAGSLQHAAESNDPLAAIKMALIAIPVYATPMVAMVQLASMFQHGNSIAAAFTLLVLGTGLNLGMLWWIGRNYTWKKTCAWVGMLIAIVLALAYLVDKPLYPKGVEPVGHTHAFDNYCNPFTPGLTDIPANALRILNDSLAPHELVSLVFLLLLIGTGAVLARVDRSGATEAYLCTAKNDELKNDIVLPPTVIGGISFAGLIIASVAGCYLYYPSRSEIFAEMRIVNTELCSAAAQGDWDTGLYWVPIHEDWLRKLRVSGYLRRQDISRYQEMKIKIVEERIELLEHALEEKEKEEANAIGRLLGMDYHRMRVSFSAK